MTGSASAPGSSGNLGPGFDVLGLALDLRCHVTATPSEAMSVDDGDGPRDLAEDHIVARAALAGAGRPMALVVDNAVPRTRGLGSSAAVMVAAYAASARAVGAEPERGPAYDAVAAIEGHGDNVGAAVYGGLVAVTADGALLPLPINSGLVPIVGVPDHQLSTGAARDALPSDVPLEAAARTASRVVALVEGLRTADPEVLAAAGGDELHEQGRGPLSPVTGAMISAARDAGALHAAWSGAGPTAIAFATVDTTDAVAAALGQALDGTGRVLVLAVDYDGLL